MYFVVIWLNEGILFMEYIYEVAIGIQNDLVDYVNGIWKKKFLLGYLGR